MSKTPAAESILVVEDEKDVRDLLAENLRREGYQVGTARSGRDALSAVRRKRPDLVLLDLMLPDVFRFPTFRERSSSRVSSSRSLASRRSTSSDNGTTPGTEMLRLRPR